MDDGNIDHILNSMEKVLPVFHRKLLRMDLDGVTSGLSRLHFLIMGILTEKSMTVSGLAGVASISKSQITSLIDKLVMMGVVERHPDKKDRRVINIVLTDKGRDLLGDVRNKVKSSIKEKLSCLTPDELSDMSAALETLRMIGEKLRD